MVTGWGDVLRQLSAGQIALAPGADIDALHAEAVTAGFGVAHADLRSVVSKADLIEAVAVALAFPDWTGRNWDALADALTDLSWLPESRLLLTLVGALDAPNGLEGEWRMLSEILEEAVSWWRTRDATLVVALA